MAIVIQTALLLEFDKYLKVVVAESMQTTPSNTQLKRLENTLKSIGPVVYEYRRLIKVLDRPQNDTIRFISYLKIAKRLVLKSSNATFRNKYQKCLHSAMLTRLNNELVKFFQTEFASSMKNSAGNENVDQLLPAFITHVSVCNLDLEELTLDIMSDNYSLPDYINRMGQLKALCLTCHDDYPYKLHDLSSIACLPSLTTIRFDHVSIPSFQPIFALKNLKKLSFIMCEISDALMSYTTKSPHTLPNLTCLEFNMCYDLKQLPSGLCNLVNLRKLSVTNCNELDVLPKQLGDLSNLESLNLHCCTKLQELPESIGSLCNLSSIDISDCLSISVLPKEIGELCGLRVLKMNGCTGLQELPVSMGKLAQLQEVICDEETSYLWMDFETDIHNWKINVVEDDRLQSFMKIVN
ncbi:uncharacterized protein LOC143535864 isoform X2 [Bidens hawaiensis]|uniref:uncharacterized protein LOC143535864 isoform X2 n=1 Tax=Bidens hawaiensis TaxID=980011 RepID=UPI004049A5A4